MRLLYQENPPICLSLTLQTQTYADQSRNTSLATDCLQPSRMYYLE